MDVLKKEDGESLSIVEKNIAALKEILPDAFTEDGIDFDVLRQLLGDDVAEGEEKYGLTWHGKKKARQISLTPSTGTLRPCPEESVDWESTRNLFIEGDNLEVLKLLQKSYAGKVKMIYIDPPYNTGGEFIYPDKFQDNLDTYLRYTDQKGEDGLKLTSNTEVSGRYHTNWLNMMYPRIKLAKNFLSDQGVLFISIDDNEQANLKKLCDEIFGEENFVATVIWHKVYAPKNSAKHFSEDHDFILVYAKSAEVWRPELLPRTEDQDALYKNPDNDPRGPWMSDNLTARNYYGDGQYEITGPTGKSFGPGRGRYWRQSLAKFQEMDADNRIWWGVNGDGMPRQKRFLSEVSDGRIPQTIWHYSEVGHTQEAKRELLQFVSFKHTENVLNSVKPSRLIERMLTIGTRAESEDIVLDFFAGSASSAQAVIKKNIEDKGNRRFICVQLPEPLKKEEDELHSIFDLGKSRIANFSKSAVDENPALQNSIDFGFKVLKLDSSNIRAWNPDASDLEQTLLDHSEHLVEGRSEQDVLYELLLKRGVDLTVPIEEKEIAGKTVHSIGYGVLFACLDETIDKAEIETLGQGITKWHKELEPAADTQVVFRDSAFADDIAKTNMTAILEQNGIAHVRSL